MKRITSIEIIPANRQEILPGFSDDFPHIVSRAEIDRYPGSYAPWHWHGAVELFRIESGELEYNTPNARMIFPAGSGGLVNSGVPHMSRSVSRGTETIQLLHLFDPVLVSGPQNGRIAEKYVLPLLASGCEIIPLQPGSKAMELLDRSFRLDPNEHGYELRIRAALSEIWLQLAAGIPEDGNNAANGKTSDKLKRMMIYVHEHYPEAIRIADLSASAFISERECYRLFREHLHCSPLEYITGCRLQAAREMLRGGNDPITAICHRCGFSTSSHFGKTFAESFGCTPSQYRRNWQDYDKKGRK